MILTTFLVNVFCGFINCVYNNPYPSDPLLSSSSLSDEPTSNNEISRILRRNAMTDGRISRSANNNSVYPEKLEPIVFTDNGGLEGYIMKTIRQRNIFAFEGVPFGESTAGANRFQPPVPKRPWTGIRAAKKPGPYCLQFNIIRPRIMGDENCLFLNVYTPTVRQYP
jgi:hypothetical protein